jgi:hypothetical protein
VPSSDPYRPFSEAAEADHAVINHKGTSNTDIDAEFGWNFHDMITALDKFGR